jgi:type I restriction enzyme R subunit
VMEPRMLYESPFTDISPLGPDELFGADLVDRILHTLGQIRLRTSVG